ncbi:MULTISPECIES: GntR family transcriptional regulator [Xanthobacter]|uniref:GntR family transcriptional regulator n=1 Tax=Xanthobacter TaxID=279 RepID=UPI001F2EFE60|nr:MULTISPECIES: GntR family transcriptional regulator [unclassified Xanthobacter]
MSVDADGSESIVDRVYAELRSRAISFDFKPGERLNEGDLAKGLGVSRTPLREALNRLNTEGFLRFSPGRGFFCRELDAQEIFDLYELRKSLEVAAVRISAERASDGQIDSLLSWLNSALPSTDLDTPKLLELDEEFHERLMALCGNAEMLRVLRNVNARIHFVRQTDMTSANRSSTQQEHRVVVEHLKRRDGQSAALVLSQHIDRRIDRINAAIKEGYAQIYMASNARRS